MKRLNVFALIVTTTFAAQAAAQNLLTDPGFEDPTKFTTDGPPFVGFWEGFSSGGGTSALSSTAPRNGASHLSLSITATNNTFAGAFQDVPGLTPGQSVVWSVWVRKNTPTLDLDNEMRIEWRNSVSNTEISRTPNQVHTGSITDVYQQFLLPSVVPAGVDTARVVYAIQTFSGGEANNGTVFVDDASFTAIPEPATMSLLALGAIGLTVLRRRK